MSPPFILRIGLISHTNRWTTFWGEDQACLLSLDVRWKGHEAFFIVAPKTASEIPSQKLYKEFYPDVELLKPFDSFEAFYNSSKAEDLLDWNHEDHSWPKHTEGPIV